MKLRVLVADKISEQGVTYLREAGLQTDLSYEITPTQLISTIGEYDALIVRSRTKVTKEVFAGAKKLKVVGRAGVGLDNIDAKEAQRLNIKIVSTPTAPTIAVAELAFGLMLSLARRIPAADASMKAGEWQKSKYVGKQLTGRTLGVVGFGRIGRELVKFCKGFGMTAVAYDVVDIAKAAHESGVSVAKTLTDLLAASDFVSLHVPLLPETKHLIGGKEIDSMKDGAFLINTSRGGVIDEEAMLKALDGGKLGGVGLDVFEKEPPVNMRLVQHKLAVCTPHIAAQTDEAQEAAGILVAQEVVAALGLPTPRQAKA